MLISIPVSALLDGDNSLKIWSKDSSPGTIAKITIIHSAEAKLLKESFDSEGGLAGLAKTGSSVISHTSSDSAAKNLIYDMETDLRLSPSEKATWKASWLTINEDYTKAVSFATSLQVPFAALQTTYTALTGVLTTAGVWSKPAVSYILTGSEISDASVAYTQAYRNLIDACTDKVAANAKEHTEAWSAQGATNDSDLRDTNDITKIDGGKIYAGSEITIGNIVDGDYCKIDQGDIDFYRYISGGHRLAKSLKRLEFGVGEADQKQVIPGYFVSPPKIVVSPRSLPLYNPAYSSQTQVMSLNADDIVLETPGKYAFTPVCKLTNKAGTSSISPSIESNINGASSAPVILSNIVLPPNTVESTVYFRVTGFRWSSGSKLSVTGGIHVEFYNGTTKTHYVDKGFTVNQDILHFITPSLSNTDITYIKIYWFVDAVSITEATLWVDSYDVVTKESITLGSGSVNWVAIGE